MGFGSFIGAIIEAAAEASVNSYTPEEKEMIIQVRDLMRRKGREDAAEELDQVIKDFDLGYTKSSKTTSTTRGPLSAAEYAYEIKKLIKSSYGSLDTHTGYAGNTALIKLNFCNKNIVTFKVENGIYIGKEFETNTSYMFSKEIADAEEDIIVAVRKLRN